MTSPLAHILIDLINVQRESLAKMRTQLRECYFRQQQLKRAIQQIMEENERLRR